ncbi:MAG: glycosyltransferase family 39 protein [Kouleothrix sp.]|nr:glycosyltransferase family 39 protein [Kouleothrix sp.]
MERGILKQQPTIGRLGRRAAAGPLAALALLAAGLWNLSGPPMWWDEGWTLSVARNWAELGHYGRLLDGQLAPPGLEASFVVTAPVALGFRLLGVGIWQGRVPGVVFMVAALGLMYYLARRLYDRRVAIGTLFVLLLMPMHPQLHPLIMGRQVLGELPMLVYLLGGYACLLAALGRSAWFLPAAIGLWGVALITKAQVLPFWAVSLLVPLGAALLARRWRAALLLGLALPGAWLAGNALVWLWVRLIHGHTLPGAPVQGLYDVTALVLTSFNRTFALYMTALVGLPLLAGLGYAAWRLLRPCDSQSVDAGRDSVRLALLAFTASWCAWFALLSVGVPRYLFPASFVGGLFIAVLLRDLTGGYDLKFTLASASAALRLRVDRRVAGAWLAIALLALTVPITLITLNGYYFSYTNPAATEIAAFLNTQTAPGARIETYESELHFLLNRRYHYPPDQTHVELNRRSLTHQDIAIDYDPLAANPDYLVVGRFARENGLYQPAIDSGAFRLLRSYDGYELYERAR